MICPQTGSRCESSGCMMYLNGRCMLLSYNEPISEHPKQGETPRTDKVLRNAARHPLAMGGQIFLPAPAPELLDLCRTLERELAQMAAQKAELEAKLAEAGRDAERQLDIRRFGWKKLTGARYDDAYALACILEEDREYDAAIDAERKESGNG